jgi:hypothetical protein
MRIFLDVKLVDKRKGQVIWQEQRMTEYARFAVDTDPLVTRFNQKKAVANIAGQIAKRIYLKTMERF